MAGLRLPVLVAVLVMAFSGVSLAAHHPGDVVGALLPGAATTGWFRRRSGVRQAIPAPLPSAAGTVARCSAREGAVP